MKKPLLILFLLSFFLSAQAQDKKLQRLYNHAQYCDCIERFNKLPHKMKTSDALFIAASSYYHLFKTPDNECNIKDPLSKCLITLAKIKKSKSNDLIEGLPELIEDAVSAGFEIYCVDMKNRQWEDALTMIERIKKVQTNSALLIDQGRKILGLAKIPKHIWFGNRLALFKCILNCHQQNQM